MAQHINSLRVYFQLLSTPELVVMRHEAIGIGDTATKELLDEEFKRRDVTSGGTRGVQKRES